MIYEHTLFLLTSSIILFIGYIITVSIIYFFIIRKLEKNKYHRRYYTKALTFQLTLLQYRRIRLLAQFIFGILAVIVIIFLLLRNSAPFGVKNTYSLTDNGSTLFGLTPKERYKVDQHEGIRIFRQVDDFIYFVTSMPFHFDNAKVKITYINSGPEQELHLGYKDQVGYHYFTKVIHTGFINALTWSFTGSNTLLYQREKVYGSLNAFINNTPKDGIIGIYNLNSHVLSPYVTLTDYQPKKDFTIIDTPLRGSHTLYVYLNNEAFNMSFYKQDLNWYGGEDSMSIKVYKDDEEVMTINAMDDGVTDDSKQLSPIQKIEVKNPGPDLPESGVYKVVVLAPGDTIIRRIETNLHKIVFADSVFPVENKEVYGQLISNTKPVTLFTNALYLTANTYHERTLQEISVDGKSLKRDKVQKEKTATPSASGLTEITIPKSDVVLKGFLGYFAFSEESFFNPMKYLLYPIKNENDIKLVDYILTDYKKPQKNGDWYTAEVEFDLKNAVVDKNKLSWIIRAPGLKKNNREIVIKNIEVEMTKDPLPLVKRLQQLWNRH
jgi:hypothetical protein